MASLANEQDIDRLKAALDDSNAMYAIAQNVRAGGYGDIADNIQNSWSDYVRYVQAASKVQGGDSISDRTDFATDIVQAQLAAGEAQMYLGQAQELLAPGLTFAPKTSTPSAAGRATESPKPTVSPSRATSSSTLGTTSFAGQHGLWSTYDCSFSRFANATFELSADGRTLTATIPAKVTFTRTQASDSVVGEWNVTYGAPALVTILQSGAVFTETAKTPVRVTGSSCDLPSGTVIATFSAATLSSAR